MHNVASAARHNIVTVDSKGRVLIPYHIRELLDIDIGSQFIIMSNYNGEIKMLPLRKGKTAEIHILMVDKPGSLTAITQALAHAEVDIVLSQSKTLERGHLAEWSAIADISECSSLKKLERELSKMPVVKRVIVNNT
ncbi:MAG: ACT domain-containing protein [Candidatus Aenigmatarchaeota archaeon]